MFRNCRFARAKDIAPSRKGGRLEPRGLRPHPELAPARLADAGMSCQESKMKLLGVEMIQDVEFERVSRSACGRLCVVAPHPKDRQVWFAEARLGDLCSVRVVADDRANIEGKLTSALEAAIKTGQDILRIAKEETR